MARAVHRLEGEKALLALGYEHILLIFCPVAGAFPQSLRHTERSTYLHIAVGLDLGAHIVLQDTVNSPSFRMPEDLARVLFVDMEQVKLLAYLAVVPLCKLLKVLEIEPQVLRVCECCSIDSLEHRALLVPSPVGSCDREQLDGLGVDHLCVLHMGSPAKVGELVHCVDGDYLVLRQVVDKLCFVRLVLEKFKSLLAAYFLPDKVLFLIDDIPHPFLDLGEIVHLERTRKVKIIIKTIFNGWSDGNLCLREHL